MADEILDPPGNAGDTNGNPDSNGSKTATDKPTPVFTHTKEDVTRITSREVGKVLAEKAALEQRLAAFEEEKRVAEEAKMSAAQRAEAALKKKEEAAAQALATLTQERDRERTLRLDTVRSGKASSLAASVAAQLANPGLLPHVEQVIASRLIIEPVEGGGERVVIQLGAPGDTEPLESGFAKFREEHLAPFFKVAGGSGGRHGAGAVGGSKGWETLTPNERIKFGLPQKR